MKKRCGWIIIISFLCVIAFMLGTYALYTSRNYQKAVISTTRDEVPFSSNYLRLIPYSNDAPQYDSVSPSISVSDGGDTVSFKVTINNFPITKISQTASKNISYEIKFIVEEGSGEYRINPNYLAFTQTINTSGEATFSHSLQTGTRTDEYTITMPASDLGKAHIKICARPTNDSLSIVSNKMLAAVIHPVQAIQNIAFECRGEFPDSAEGIPSDYDAFNYHFYITKGKAMVTLKWNSAYVIPDPGFQERVNGQYNADNNELTFEMDYDEMESCDIIFYRKKGRNDKEAWQAAWENLAAYISVTGIEIK